MVGLGRRQPRHDATHLPSEPATRPVLCAGLWWKRRFLFGPGRQTHGANDRRTDVQGAGPADLQLTASGAPIQAVSPARTADALSLVPSARRSRLRSIGRDSQPQGRRGSRSHQNIENNPMQSSRRPAWHALESKLTRRANQGHSFIIPQSCKRPSPRNSGRVRRDCSRKILTHTLKLHRLAAANDRLRVAEPRACRVRLPEEIPRHEHCSRPHTCRRRSPQPTRPKPPQPRG